MGLRGREGGVRRVIATNSVLVSQPFFLEVWESVKRGRRKVSDKVGWRENGRESILGKVMGWVRQERTRRRNSTWG